MEDIGVEEAVEEKGVGLSLEELVELAVFESDLCQLSGQLGAHKGARAKGARKVREWDEKEGLKGQGEEERMGWAASCLEKAKKKLEEKDKAVADLERAVERLEGWVGALRRKGGLGEKKEKGWWWRSRRRRRKGGGGGGTRKRRGGGGDKGVELRQDIHHHP